MTFEANLLDYVFIAEMEEKDQDEKTFTSDKQWAEFLVSQILQYGRGIGFLRKNSG